MRVGRVNFNPSPPKRPGDSIVGAALRRASLAERCRSLAAEIRMAGFTITAGHLLDVAEALEKPPAPVQPDTTESTP